MVHAFRTLLGLYALCCLAIVLWPTPVDRSFVSELLDIIAVLQQSGLEFITYDRVEFLANVAMFIPLGALGVLSFPQVSWWFAPIVALGVSMSIELVQFMLLAERFASYADVGANVSGAIIGSAVAASG
ncbi:VanZ family protein [Marisediminicola sp. LYQ85]|uniref:VanZ family protein n=1 Tax=Marisediminicola sp. LYQ85 TaxID=3391062 RepID=UPI0039837A95